MTKDELIEQLQNENRRLKEAMRTLVEQQNLFREQLEKFGNEHAKHCYLWQLSKLLVPPQIDPAILYAD